MINKDGNQDWAHIFCYVNNAYDADMQNLCLK